jgi:hypothetical protein
LERGAYESKGGGDKRPEDVDHFGQSTAAIEAYREKLHGVEAISSTFALWSDFSDERFLAMMDRKTVSMGWN